MKIVKPLTIPMIRRGWASVFLAGSIEMGKARDWQSHVTESLKDYEELVVMNPRRDDWGPSWVQSIENDQFRWQVQWELNGLERADIIALYLDPGTMSPISLLELGLYARSRKIVCCCPDGFWRKGNVEVLAAEYAVHLVNSLDDLIRVIRKRVSDAIQGG